VYPLEVEAVLGNHPSVAHVAVVPRPDEVMGEIGVAVVVPHDRRSPPTLEELRRFASDKLAAFKLPEAIRVVDALPYNGQQKVDRRRLTQEEAASVV
jgi:acyl-CoA synthetase (AMP-forming)/AMP-acid ligase II